MQELRRSFQEDKYHSPNLENEDNKDILFSN